MMGEKINLLLSQYTFVRIHVEAIFREDIKKLFQMDKMLRPSFDEHEQEMSGAKCP